jgi:hypothetical protein
VTRSRRARVLANLAVALVAVVAALLLAEVAVRIFFPHARDHVVPAGLFEIDEHAGWKLRPGRAGVHRSRYFEVEYRVNHLGFRDPERDPVKRPGARRWLVYGDSQVFGWGLPAGERFTDVLEERLAGTEVWNLAVPGYGLDQQVIAYETWGIPYDADEVVFLVTPSTLSRNRFDRLFRKPKPRFRLDAGGELRLDPVPPGSRSFLDALYRLLSPFHLPYFIEGRLQRRQQAAAGEGQHPVTQESQLDALARQILLRARESADRAGQRMRILANFQDEASWEAVRAFAAEHGIPLLEITMERGDDRLTFGPHDRHWNAEANRVIAGQILDKIAGGPQEPPAGSRR